MENKQGTKYERSHVSRAWVVLQSKRKFKFCCRTNERKKSVLKYEASEGIRVDMHSVPRFLEMRIVTKKNRLNIIVF